MSALSVSDVAGAADRAFRFGFLASDLLPPHSEMLVGWRRSTASGLTVWAHPETPMRELVGSGWHAFVIGDAYVAHGTGSVEQILSALALNGDPSELDRLGGRYAVIVRGAHGTRAYHDAFGARSVYYRLGEATAFASHAALLASAFGDEPHPDAIVFRDSPAYTQRGTSYLPGDSTMYRSIFALIPNTCFDLERRRAVRYWPVAPPRPTAVEAFFLLCDEYFARTAEYLAPRYLPLMGVTGGTDGRALIAGLRHYGIDGSYFTWEGGRLQEGERELVEAMARHLGVKHAFVGVGRKTEAAMDEGLRLATRLATGLSRGASSLTANTGVIAPPGGVFLRGYGGEILRGFYNRHNRVLDAISPEALAALYFTRRVEHPGRAVRMYADAAFAGFIERAGYPERFVGLDALDVFYWEHRMGTWGAVMLNEMDPVLYSMAGFNSRRLFESAFGLKAEYRLGAQLLLDLTARYDPTLATMGMAS